MSTVPGAPISPSQLQKWFRSIDKDQNGVLSVVELQAALAAGGMNFSLAMVANIMRQVDKDGSNTITLPEFERLHVFLTTIQSSFAAFDRDSDGRISYEEMQAALKRMGYQVDREVLAAMFARFDPLRQGALGLQEFLALTLFIRSANATFRAFDPYGRGSVMLNFNQFLYATAHTI